MTTWYLLPSMGTNASMYDPLRAELGFEIRYVDWPRYREDTTFAEIGKRIIEEQGICDGDIVGGTSLGGMIALEIARLRKLRAVVLISSATSLNEIQPLLKLLSPLASVAPISFFQYLAGKYNHSLTRMFAEANPEFIQAMCRFLNQWKGSQISSNLLFRIHGKRDHVISCPKSNCEIVPGAGHLLAFTHPKKCGEFLNRVKQRLEMKPG